MRLTFHEARALGIDPVLLEAARTAGAAAERSRAVREDLAVGTSRAPDDGLNKLERSFRDEVLAPAFDRGDIGRFDREPLKFRLAGRCWYTIDFVVWRDGCHPLTCIEVKGGWFRDDARVKVKVAAAMYPEFRWLLVFREGRHGWKVHRATARGIEQSPIIVPWINVHGG